MPARQSLLRALILVVAVAAPLATVLPGAFPVVDDGVNSLWMLEVEQRNPEFLPQLHAAVLEGAYGGHYRPTQDVIFVAAWELGGPTGWTRIALAVYVLLHAGSALLLVAILRSLGAGTGAWLAALAFGVHPVASSVFVCAQFAHNVPGLFFTLLACWIVGKPPPRLLRNLGAALCVFLAAGANPNWLISAPCAVAFAAALHLGLPARRAWRPWLTTAAYAGLAVVVATALRLQATGTLTTTHPGYSGPRRLPPLRIQLNHCIDAFFALEPSRSTAVVSRGNPFLLDPGNLPLWIAILIGLLGPLLLLLPREPSAALTGRSFRAWVFGLGLTVIMLAPYFLLVGFYGQDRYLYPAVAGLAAASVLLIEWPLRGLVPSRWVRWMLAIPLCPALVVVTIASLEAVTSIQASHRHARQVLDALHSQVEASPELRRVQVLGRAASVGRSGLIYPHSIFLQGQLTAMLRRPGFHISVPCALEDIASGGQPGVGVFRISPSGTVQRILSGPELTLEELCFDFLNQWRILWRDRSDHPIATLPSAELARTFVTVLDESLGPEEVHHLARDLLEVRTGDLPPAGQGVGLLVPSTLACVIRELAGHRGAVTIALRSIQASDGAATIVEAALEVAAVASPKQALVILAASAVAKPDCRDRVRQIARRRFPSLDHERFDEGLDAEIDARRLLVGGDVDRAAKEFVRAIAAYRVMGVHRPEAWLGKLRCDLAKGGAPEAMPEAVDYWKHHGVPLAAEAPWSAMVPPTVSGIEVLLGRPADGTATREQVELVVWLTNRGAIHVPGGDAPYATSLRWEWSDESRDLRMPAGARRLPDHGVPIHGQIVLPALVSGPGRVGCFRLRAIVEVGNQTFVGELEVDCR